MKKCVKIWAKEIENGNGSCREFKLPNKEDEMELLNLLLFIVIGLVAGWLAGRIMRGKGFGLVGDLIVGVIGAFLGGWLFSLLGISVGGIFGSLVTALVGAIILLLVLRLIKKG